MAKHSKKPIEREILPPYDGDLEQVCVSFSGVGQLAEGNHETGRLGGLYLEFGKYGALLVITEEVAEGLIEQLEAFLDGEAPEYG